MARLTIAQELIVQRDTEAIHLHYKIMLLQDILFGTFVPPDVPATRKHRIGFDYCNQYIPKTPRPKKERTMPDSEAKVLKIMKMQTKPISPLDMEKKTPWSRNHCNMIMCKLWKQGLLLRVKVQVGNTRTFHYTYKKE